MTATSTSFCHHTVMIFTPKNQLENMLSAAAAQVSCGNNVADNTARIIALQAQINLQNAHASRRLGPPNMLDNWF
ncbi:hypothetical protein KBY65_13300 [Cyanobium sp. Alchichica 3B3-8F6]|uniref:hypothetical protein n=1 Tax=Cyanobium sp. Alchichica 3B3-8F6 TaxID=2823696 RepID=UPI0020CEA798|nr:hypothetical protein [Cyanobium sp. Alchichica 3B3-8F6]MCP9883431.1 hypothetical protein [Cyanobium sp. Alchichica 3B3-8F6]